MSLAMFTTHPRSSTPARGRLSGLAALTAAAALALTACSGADSASSDPSGSAAPESAAAPGEDPGEAGFDVSSISEDTAISDLLPEEIKKAGELKNGAATDYAPAEYRKADGQTPTGYDVDMVKALGALMGVKGTTTHAEFDSLIPQIGSKFDIGASSFTITREREAQFTMVAYLKAGFQYATAKGNPAHFDPTNICGTTIGVQTGTAQQEWLEDESKKCESDGKKAIDIKPLSAQTEVSTKVASGQYDAMIADSPVIGYVVTKSGGQIEKQGEIFESALHGIIVPKDNEKLAEAVRAGVQKLMDDGTLKKIMAVYGADDAVLSKAEVNPAVSE